MRFSLSDKVTGRAYLFAIGWTSILLSAYLTDGRHASYGDVDAQGENALCKFVETICRICSLGTVESRLSGDCMLLLEDGRSELF